MSIFSTIVTLFIVALILAGVVLSVVLLSWVSLGIYKDCKRTKCKARIR